MKCPDCKERMKVDIENQRYICECDKIINWGGENENKEN